MISGHGAAGHKSANAVGPSAWVRRFAPRVAPGGTVLDLAAGRGRHTRYFLERGHPVLAVDRDLSGLSDLVAAAPPGLEVHACDLETGGPFPLAGRRFAAVVVARYLHRPLLPALVAAVAPGGLLLYETFALGQERLGRPRRPEFLLTPGELLETVRGRLTVLAYSHGLDHDPAPAMLQRIAAMRDDPAPFDKGTLA